MIMLKKSLCNIPQKPWLNTNKTRTFIIAYKLYNRGTGLYLFTQKARGTNFCTDHNTPSLLYNYWLESLVPVWLYLFVIGEREIVKVRERVLTLLDNTAVIDVFDEFESFFVSVH